MMEKILHGTALTYTVDPERGMVKINSDNLTSSHIRSADQQYFVTAYYEFRNQGTIREQEAHIELAEELKNKF